jgi:hypothetical protein
MAKQIFTFVAPDGKALHRTSAARQYTHAILHKRGETWKIASCVGRPELVAARLETWGKGSPDVIAVECRSSQDVL